MTRSTTAEPPPPQPPTAARASARTSVMALLRSLRPHQWVKNLFVAAPLVFAQKLGDSYYLGRSALAVLAFCALSGAVYAFNDVRDIEADRLHPTKRYRPIAAGELSRHAALGWAALLAVSALTGCLLLSWKLAALAAAYLVQNVAYTLRLKQVAFLDVLRITMLVTAAATCVAYAAYTLDARTVAEFGTNRLIYSAPFVAFGVLRFLWLALWRPRDESPTEAMLKDPWFLIDLAGAVGLMLYVIYG